MSIKFCPRPVVVAPFNLTLGGGAEISLHAARRQPHAETYIGLVETGIGLIPGGGGTKEMLLRAVDSAAALAPPDPKDPPSRFAQSAEMNAALKRTLETIAMAKVSTSAAEARPSVCCCPLTASRSIANGCCSMPRRRPSRWQRLVTRLRNRAPIPAPGTASLAVLEHRRLSDGRGRIRF